MAAIKETVATLYDTDFHAWTEQQAALLKRGAVKQADLPNIIEEIETLGRNDVRELESRLAVLLMHLLKWEHDSFHRSKSWEFTIEEQRRSLEDLLEESPSLRAKLSDRLPKAYRRARLDAEKETGISITRFPNSCPYSLDDVMRADWVPTGE